MLLTNCININMSRTRLEFMYSLTVPPITVVTGLDRVIVVPPITVVVPDITVV
jgi:hypothetical protein